FIQLEGGIGAPVINIDPTIIIETINAGTTSSQSLTISNVGELDLEYGIVVTYPDNSKSAKAISPSTGNTKVVLDNISQDPVSKPGGSPDPSDDVILHYDGDNSSAIGLTNGGAMRCAAVFTPNEVGDYIGMELSEIEVYINDAPITTKAQVYNYGLTNLPGPGEMILEQDWSFSATAWNTVVLNEPVVISGGDIWVGYWVDHGAGTFPAGVDGGPHHPNGDWISSGPGWHHLSDNTALDFNWNIRAVLTGDPIIQWLSVSSTSGTVAVGGSEDIDVNFDATNLEIGSYYAELVVNSNDPEAPQSIVNVNLGVLTGINENEKTAVMLYPNPATNFFNIKSDHEILNVELMNLMGQRILAEQVNAKTHQINTSELQAGIYIIKVDTESGTFSSRISID
ncbi:MAG: T9SS type A sorting domain-containing protein, partial [Bacteroidales bacterium]|nr:T9SS type A sorting domain-containing protein [Bacteroidales bacterium]